MRYSTKAVVATWAAILLAFFVWGVVEASATPTCTFPYCTPLVGGVRIKQPVTGGERICTAGPIVRKGEEEYVMTAAHCVLKDKEHEWFSAGECKLGVDAGSVGGVGLEGDAGLLPLAKCPHEDYIDNWGFPVPWVDYDEIGPLPQVGDTICVVGAVSGFHCGKVIEVPTSYKFIYCALNELGDSGGAIEGYGGLVGTVSAREESTRCPGETFIRIGQYIKPEMEALGVTLP